MPSAERTIALTLSAKQKFNAFARHKHLAVVLTGLVAFAIGAIFTAVRVPVPRVHDEFSYLLAADTFSHGRVTNPTHPMWEHFETFHVIHQPSYASKYQPGQGMVLALGTLLGGHPIVGAWIASALAAAAVCWMLQGWVPSRWALLGGLLVATHGMIQVRWSLSYWGGGLPMAGGALMFGALPRIKQHPHVTTSLLMATGAILLASTRPFEGFLVGSCVAAALLLWMFSPQRPAWSTILGRVVLPSVCMLAAGIAALSYYNLQVTGDPLRMPYQVHEAEYAYSPLFIWRTPQAPPHYRHDVLQDFFTGWAFAGYEQQQTIIGFLQAKLAAVQDLWLFFLGSALCLPLVMLRDLLARRQLLFVWFTLLVFFAAESTVPWTYPHYFAPVAPILFLLIVQGMRSLSALPRWGQAWAIPALLATVTLHFATLPILLAQYAAWQPEGWEWNRARLTAQLETTPGEHLVLVQYTLDHNGHAEWVYNQADLAGAKIVWARQMGQAKDAKLLNHFHDRTVWQINADAEQPELVAYQKDTGGEVYSAAVSNTQP